jgi:hypothetical protein
MAAWCARGALCKNTSSKEYRHMVVNDKQGVCQEILPSGPKQGPAYFTLCAECYAECIRSRGQCQRCYRQMYDYSNVGLKDQTICNICGVRELFESKQNRGTRRILSAGSLKKDIDFCSSSSSSEDEYDEDDEIGMQIKLAREICKE